MRVSVLVTTRPDRRVLLYFDGAQRIDLTAQWTAAEITLANKTRR
jgi:hypothetical protein